MGTRHSNVIRDVLKMFGSLNTKVYKTGVNKGKASECFLTDTQAREYLQSRRVLTKEAKELLSGLGAVPSSGSAEGKFYDALVEALSHVFTYTGHRYTVERQKSFDNGKHIFDFFIPEGPLLIEFDEKGGHHSKEINEDKDAAAVCPLIRVEAQTEGLSFVLKALSKF
jgi:hypothetical protein